MNIPSLRFNKIILSQQSSYSHSSIPTSNTADSHTQNGRLLSPFSHCVVLLPQQLSARSGWMLSSVLHVFITDPCSGHYWLRSELNDLQEDTHIQPLAGHFFLSEPYAGNMAEQRGGYPTHSHESEVITHWVYPSLIHCVTSSESYSNFEEQWKEIELVFIRVH